MRIGVSGTHGTGKTTLIEDVCARLPGHGSVEEPYLLLEEEGHLFGHPPSPDDYRVQLRRSLLLLRSPAERIVFDRTPVDFLAYLAAYGHDVEEEADPDVLESAMASLDLLVVLPITAETERFLPEADLPRLRQTVNDALLGLVHDDPLGAWSDLPILEATGPLERRTEAVLAAAARLDRP
ncbi:AAA family ATPase [Streptomyces sp. NPDC047108]|uniref:AAA family ATPase n=1 Tax=Streptomyces sp. NPDC047108 TaxID=3155025 RepID=UPI0033F5D664